MNLEYLKGKKLMEPNFWEKNLISGECQKYFQNSFFLDLAKKLVHWYVDFLG